MGYKEARVSSGLTQKETAKALGVSRATVAMWEAGKSNPTAEKLPALAKLYGCTVDELLRDVIVEV